jgi:hypothetical protein
MSEEKPLSLGLKPLFIKVTPMLHKSQNGSQVHQKSTS